MLVAVMFLLFVFTISLSVAAPIIARSIRLDRERETIERGKQYRRAIQLYYRRFRAYPPTIDALLDTNNIRFLRKRYVDPMTRKDDWQPILFGQNKAPVAMGFFGQPFNGTGSTGVLTVAGLGPGATSGLGASPSSGGTSSLFSSGDRPIPGSSAVPTSPSSGNSGAPGFASDITLSQGSSSGNTSNSNAQSFGGGGIIGVSPAGGAISMIVYKKKDRYDEWEFTYDPIDDITLMSNNALANEPGANSLVGIGSGPNGTGPMINPGSNSQGTDAPVQ